MKYFLRILIVFTCLSFSAQAHDGHKEFGWSHGSFIVTPTISIDSFYGNSSNAWGGNATEIVGGKVNGWSEYAVTPGLDAQFDLGDSGMFYARVSGVWSATRTGLDAAGSNLDDESVDDTTLEDAYVGWKSGDLFPSFGEDAFDLSVGSQSYSVGSGFLIHDGGSDGGDRGGFWMGARSAFDMTGIARFKTDALKIETVYLRPDDKPDSSTDVGGANIEYAFNENTNFGVSYWKIFDSDEDRRDGLNVYDIRADIKPFKAIPQLQFSGEFAKENNGSKNDSRAWWALVGYDFDDHFGWDAEVSYRYAHFSGDDGSGGDNKAFDPLFYGSTELGTWYLGEIAGEYIIGNSNLNVHTLRLKMQPSEAVTINLLYYYFRLDEETDTINPRPPTDPRVSQVADKDLAQEFNFSVDWTVNDILSISALGGILLPESGGEDYFGDDKNWYHSQVYASIAF